jgi:hypothetical protein
MKSGEGCATSQKEPRLTLEKGIQEIRLERAESATCQLTPPDTIRSAKTPKDLDGDRAFPQRQAMFEKFRLVK